MLVAVARGGLQWQRLLSPGVSFVGGVGSFLVSRELCFRWPLIVLVVATMGLVESFALVVVFVFSSVSGGADRTGCGQQWDWSSLSLSLWFSCSAVLLLSVRAICKFEATRLCLCVGAFVEGSSPSHGLQLAFLWLSAEFAQVEQLLL